MLGRVHAHLVGLAAIERRVHPGVELDACLAAIAADLAAQQVNDVIILQHRVCQQIDRARAIGAEELVQVADIAHAGRGMGGGGDRPVPVEILFGIDGNGTDRLAGGRLSGNDPGEHVSQTTPAPWGRPRAGRGLSHRRGQST